MGVNVDQSGTDDATGGIEFDCIIEPEKADIERRIDSHDDAIGGDGHISHTFADPIDDSTAPDDDS